MTAQRSGNRQAAPHPATVTFIGVGLKVMANGYTPVDERHSGQVDRCRPPFGTDPGKGVMGLPTHRRRTTTAILIGLLALTAACTGSDVTTQPVTPAPPTSPSPTSTIDPRAQPAVSAYEAFNDATNEAQRNPVGPKQKWPVGADFTKSSFDPIKTEFIGYIWSLESQGVEYRGTPDTPHVSVRSIALNEKPWPTIILTDCQTGGEWDSFVISTGKRVPDADNGPVPPPWLIRAKMIYYQGHWGVHSTTVDKGQTCTA